MKQKTEIVIHEIIIRNVKVMVKKTFLFTDHTDFYVDIQITKNGINSIWFRTNKKKPIYHNRWFSTGGSISNSLSRGGIIPKGLTYLSCEDAFTRREFKRIKKLTSAELKKYGI